MQVWLASLVSVVVVSLVSLIGVFSMAVDEARYKTVLLFVVSFSVGSLFGDAFIHLIPEAFRRLGHGPAAPLFIIMGILVFFVLEKYLRWRHCHIPTSDAHPHQLAAINLVGDGLHNFIDGLIIGASYQAGLAVGVSTTLAVIFHEIPQELSDFGILLYSGISRGKALWLNFLCTTTAIAGTVVALVLGERSALVSAALLPFAAGGFIYIAGADLIPELKRDVNPRRSAVQFAAIVLGVAVMASLTILER